MTNAAIASPSSSVVNPLSVEPSVIDSTRDINGYIRLLLLLPSHLFDDIVYPSDDEYEWDM